MQQSRGKVPQLPETGTKFRLQNSKKPHKVRQNPIKGNVTAAADFALSVRQCHKWFDISKHTLDVKKITKIVKLYTIG